MGGNELTIYTVATDSLQEFTLPLGVSFLYHAMSWSPDGKHIAFVVNVHGASVMEFYGLEGDTGTRIETRG